MKKIFIGLLLVTFFSMGMFQKNVKAEEMENQNEAIAEIVTDIESVTLPYDNELVKVGQDRIINYLISKGIDAEVASIDYTKELQKIQEDLLLSDELVLDYISHYLSEVAEIQLVDGSNQSEVDSVNSKLISQSFSEKRNQNVEAIKELAERNQVSTPLNRTAKKPLRSLNVKKATDYALRFANGNNGVDYPIFASDCTNFASQIAKAGGIQSSNSYKNYSGSYWHPSALSRNKAWYNAQAFFNFFNAEGMRTYGAGNKSEVNKYGEAGDMLCYIRRSSGAVDHVAYVNRKTNGKVYISQHSVNRRDKKFDDIDVFSQFSYVFVLKFRYW